MFTLLKNIFSFFFPPSCIICSEKTDVVNICNHCHEQLPLTRDFPRPWIFSLYQYKNKSVNQCIKHIKEYPDLTLIETLIESKKFMVTGWFTGLARYHQATEIVLIPVPIHYSRFINRGFNQSELIAKSLQKILSQETLTITINTEIIKKQFATEKQALLIHKQERLKNSLTSSFTLNQKNISPNALLIIIDDVTTTGATLDAVRSHLGIYSPNVYAFTLSH